MKILKFPLKTKVFFILIDFNAFSLQHWWVSYSGLTGLAEEERKNYRKIEMSWVFFLSRFRSLTSSSCSEMELLKRREKPEKSFSTVRFESGENWVGKKSSHREKFRCWCSRKKKIWMQICSEEENFTIATSFLCWENSWHTFHAYRNSHKKNFEKWVFIGIFYFL